MLEILANGKSEDVGVVMCLRKEVVLDEFRGIDLVGPVSMMMSSQMDERVPLMTR